MDEYSLAFSVSNLGPKSFQKLLNKLGNPRSAWVAAEDEYRQLGIVGIKYRKFDNFRKEFDFGGYSKKLQREKVEFVEFGSSKYPDNFNKLENPPIGIYCKGNLSLLDNNLKMAVVGTRKITSYGKAVTESIVCDLSMNGFCIVSGLALGVDVLSHRVCLDNKGLTIAVMPCGVNCCLPSENFSTYKKIIDNDGLIISEYPMSQPPNKGTFLARNRLIAALSDGVLVTEAAEDSGSLVTAKWGLRLSKKVFAVPGSINSQMAKGSLKLLKQGAKLVTEGNDVLGEFTQNKRTKNEIQNERLKGLSKEEKKIISLLENETMTLDELSRVMEINVSKIFVCLSKLEINGDVVNNNGKFRLN